MGKICVPQKCEDSKIYKKNTFKVRNKTGLAKVASYKKSQDISDSCTQLTVPFNFSSILILKVNNLFTLLALLQVDDYSWLSIAFLTSTSRVLLS